MASLRGLPLVTLVAISFFTVAASGQEAPRPEAVFQEAWYREMAEGRFEDGLEAYRGLHENKKLDETLRARALFRMGVCLQKLGKGDDARQVFERVIDEFPGIDTVVANARRELEPETDEESGFRRKVESLVNQLGTQSVWKSNSNGGRYSDSKSAIVMSLREVGPKAAPHLFAALGSGNFYSCQNAAVLLARFAAEDSSLTPKLIGALRSGDEIVRKSLVLALKASDMEIWMRAFRELREDASADLRALAAQLLAGNQPSLEGRLDHRSEAIAGLTALSSDPDAAVRVEAYDVLGGFENSSALGTLTGGFEDPDASVRLAACEAVYRALSGPPAPRRVSSPGRGSRSYINQPESFDPSPVFKLLTEESEKLVLTAVRLLQIRQDYLDQMDRGNVFPKGAAGESALERIATILRRKETAAELKIECLNLLGSTGQPKVAAHLIESSKDPNPEVVLAAIGAMAGIGERSVVPRILDVLIQSNDKRVQDRAWTALTRELSTPNTVRLLVEHLPEIRGRANEVLSLFQWAQRKDLALIAVGHYDRLGPNGRQQILGYLSQYSASPSSSSYLGDHEAVGRVVKRGLEDPISAVRYSAVNAAQYFFSPDMVPLLVENLRDENAQTRHLAIQALQKSRDPRAIRPLLESLKDKGQNVTAAAAGALTEFADREIVADLLDLLDEDADTPFPDRGALYALQHFAAVADIPAVGNRLSRMRPDIRIAAIELLGDLQSSAALPFFREQLKSRDLSAREAAIEAMKSLVGTEILPDLVAALDDPETSMRYQALKALLTFKPGDVLEQAEVIDKLRSSLDDRTWETRSAAVNVLWHVKDPRTVPALLYALQHDEDSVVRPRRRTARLRTAPGRSIRLRRPPARSNSPYDESSPIALRAAEALKEVGSPDIVPRLLEYLADPSNPKVEYALDVIEVHARSEHAVALSLLLDRQSAKNRKKAVGILGSLKNPETIPALTRQLDEDDAELRSSAVEALAGFDDEAATAAVISVLSDEESHLRQLAARVLGNRNGEMVFEALLEAAKTETDPSVSRQLVQSLESYRRTEAIPVLLEIAGRADPGVGKLPVDSLNTLRLYPREAAVEALSSVLEGDYIDDAKSRALSTLVSMGDPRALDLVLAQVKHTSSSIRGKAASSLGLFLDPRVLPTLVELLRDPSKSVREAARDSIGNIRYYLDQKSFARTGSDSSGAVGELVKMLDDETAAVRLAAVNALARLKSRQALTSLVRLRKDPDETVRAAVERALDSIVAPRPEPESGPESEGGCR